MAYIRYTSYRLANRDEPLDEDTFLALKGMSAEAFQKHLSSVISQQRREFHKEHLSHLKILCIGVPIALVLLLIPIVSIVAACFLIASPFVFVFEYVLSFSSFSTYISQYRSKLCHAHEQAVLSSNYDDFVHRTSVSRNRRQTPTPVTQHPTRAESPPMRQDVLANTPSPDSNPKPSSPPIGKRSDIFVLCPHCGAKLPYAKSRANQTSSCIICNKLLVVPPWTKELDALCEELKKRKKSIEPHQ